MLSILNQSMCWLLSCVDTWDVYKTISIRFCHRTHPYLGSGYHVDSGHKAIHRLEIF